MNDGTEPVGRDEILYRRMDLNPDLQVDGLLGATLLLSDTFTMDPVNRTITWGKAGLGAAIDVSITGDTGRAAIMPHNRIHVNASIHGYAAPLVVDTGCAISQLNRAAYEKSQAPGKAEIQSVTRSPDRPLRVLDPARSAALVTVHHLPDLSVTLGRAPQTVALPVRFHVLDENILGFDVLRQRTITIDPVRQKIFFSPPERR